MTDTPSRTSIVMGTYNGASFIGEQLASLAVQTVPPCEIIVADDGSTDDTVARAEAFAGRCSIPFVIRRNETNLGFAENFLRAASSAAGDYIAFCDQDDIWLPEKIARCQEALSSSGSVLAVHTANLINADGAHVGQFGQRITRTQQNGPLSYGPWEVFFGFTMVFDRRLIDIVPPSIRGVDYITGRSGLAHDRWILFLANLVGSVIELDEPLVNYRQHGGNLFGSAKSGRRKRREHVMTESNRYLQSAQEQRAIVDLVAASPTIHSTQFNHACANRYWDAATDQQRARNRLYTAGSTIAETRQWLKNVARGVYRTLPQRQYRAKAALKDLSYIIDGLRERRR